MAQAAHGDAQGAMDIKDQQATFHGFLAAAQWGSLLIVQAVALLTVSFAIGAGWWAGLAAFVVIGVGAGLVMKMSGAWWAALIGLTLALGVGGVVVAILAGLMSGG